MALPLEAINAASAREKSIRHGHPSTLHLWWARRPLAACRAVLFASIVDDPSSRPEEFPTEEAQEQERQRLFRIIERLVLWENTNNEEVLNEARQEILKATDGHPPPVLDPFCGGGSIPLEAQRLGLEAHASDLNPVAVLITKALIEIPPKFAGMPPVNPEARKEMQKKLQGQDWPGASGLAEDVRYYGKWMRDEAEKRIGHLYQKAKLPTEYGGGEASIIAWIWARTIASPDPSVGGVHVPLVRSFWLSTKKGKEIWIDPIVDRNNNTYHLVIRNDKPSNFEDISRGTHTGKKATFRCLLSNATITQEYIRTEGMAHRLGNKLIAIVAQGKNRRIYLAPSNDESLITDIKINWDPQIEIAGDIRYMSPPSYGMNFYSDLFTRRQLLALNIFSDLIVEARELIKSDIMETDIPGGNIALADEKSQAYSDAIILYLSLALSRITHYWSNISTWHSGGEKMQPVFARQAIPMAWDYAEANPFSSSSGNFMGSVEWVKEVIEQLPTKLCGSTVQMDASSELFAREICPLISMDPPYYDNIIYSDISDFFYIWLRRSLFRIFPELFGTLLTPKKQELVAAPHRFNGNKNQANKFFEDGLVHVFERIRQIRCPEYPITIYYAYKQTEVDERSPHSSSTGWEIMLGGLVETGFLITGTWPIHTEMKGRSRDRESNALTSSIILVCRPRPTDANIGTRKEFIGAMKRELPQSLRQLQKGNIAPVDLAQAAIGPGMAIFSSYSKVLEADGSPMQVRTALKHINQILDEYLSEQEGEYDQDTRWALSWFEQYGMNEGPFGDAETLSKAKNISVEGLVQSGILRAGGGEVRLLKREEMDKEWDPATDKRLSVWEMTQHLIRILENEGEDAASELQHKLGGAAETARDLAYRLYAVCERKGWSQEAISYNGLVIAWPRLKDRSAEKRMGGEQVGIGSFVNDNQ